MAGMIAGALWFCSTEAQGVDNPDSLAAHGAEFKPRVIEVTDGVHVAVGFGLANSILIEGTDGVVIVDTMESARAARAVKAEFDKITHKPVKAIIYTHHHYDHIMGAAVFAGDDHPEIIAHELTLSLVKRASGTLRRAMLPRNIRQFGIMLRGKDLLNAGIGSRLVLDRRGAPSQFLPPTKTVSQPRTPLEIAGLRLELVHAPGETADQIYVWLPEKKTLLCGDNFYWAFPNLYAIRGTAYRDPQLWVDSMDQMLAEPAEHLVPSHTRPIEGHARIHEVLTNYRDAIKFVLDATLDGMNRGLTPDELVQEVKLPAQLAEQPYLKPYYGTVPWSVRTIYSGNLGWFDGNATHLFSLPPREKALRMARLAGGEDALLAKARQAVKERDFQWAAELADYLIVLRPEPGEPHSLKAQACLALGARQQSANARNYYLATARELEAAVRAHAAKSR